MQIPVDVTFKELAKSESLEARIHDPALLGPGHAYHVAVRLERPQREPLDPGAGSRPVGPSPDIGSAERSFSADVKVVEECVKQIAEVANANGIQLCLKHFPGTGAAR